AELKTFDSQAQAKKSIVRAVETVASKLGNTRAVCRKCYIHPEVLNAYLDGQLIDNLQKQAAAMGERARPRLRPEEAAVLALLRRRLAAERKSRAGKPKTLREALRRSLKSRAKQHA